MYRREFIRTVGAGLGSLALTSCAGSNSHILADRGKAKNVLFIGADDLRFEMGCYGDSHAVTPNLDALAKRGLAFNHAYCQQAVCNPSRASLLTGLRPDTIKVWDLKTHFREARPDTVTLPQFFKMNDYHVQGIGKIFHNDKERQDPISWSVPSTYNVNPHWKDWVVPSGSPAPKGKQQPTQCQDVPDNAYWDGQIAEHTVQLLGQIKQPFFLALGFWKPHLPFNAPKKYWDLYDRHSLAVPPNPTPPRDVPELALHNWKELRGYKGVPKKGGLSEELIAELRHGYYASISYLDAQIGKVIDELQRQDLLDSTIIVFWSDHGFHLGEHDLWCKTTNFELDTRTPLILSAPGKKSAGAKTDALVELVDLYPTLVDLCGLPVSSELEGTSMVPLLRNPDRPWKQAAYSQHPRPAYSKTGPTTMGYSVRTGNYRYTEWRNIESGKVEARELYDHRIDPGETINRIDDPGYTRTIPGLAQLLQNGRSCNIR